MDSSTTIAIFLILGGIFVIVGFVGDIFKNDGRHDDDYDEYGRRRGRRRRNRRRGRGRRGGYEDRRRDDDFYDDDDDDYPSRRDDFYDDDDYEERHDFRGRRNNRRRRDENSVAGMLGALLLAVLLGVGLFIANKPSDGSSALDKGQPATTIITDTREPATQSEERQAASVTVPDFAREKDMEIPEQANATEAAEQETPTGPPCVIQEFCLGDPDRIAEKVEYYKSYGLPVCTSEKGGCTAIAIGPFPSREDANIVKKEYGFKGNIVEIQDDSWMER